MTDLIFQKHMLKDLAIDMLKDLAIDMLDLIREMNGADLEEASSGLLPDDDFVEILEEISRDR